MYLPRAHREDDLSAQHGLIRARPLGLLVTHGAAGLQANAVPFVLDLAGERGTLRAHVARANPQWHETGEALVIFGDQGHYISPSLYATKRETHRVVPTWNYVAVHCYGEMRAVEDRDWLRAQVEALTTVHERDRAEPWSVSDAPENFIETMLGAIVGIEIPIARIEGKWKLSQNRSEADRTGVIDGLRAQNTPEASRMADLVAAARR